MKHELHISRREALRRLGLGAAAFAAGPALLAACGGDDDSDTAAGNPATAPGGGGEGGPIRVGIVASMTGPIGFAGQSVVNMANLVTKRINADGGLLGREIELVIKDGGSDPQLHATAARELIEAEDVVMVAGAITSAEREAMASIVADRGELIYLYPELYEGGVCEPNIFATGPVPNQQVAPFVPWLTDQGYSKFYMPSSDYLWPRTLNPLIATAVDSAGGEVLDTEYFPLDSTNFSVTVNRIMSSGADVVFLTVIPPGFGPLMTQLFEAGYGRNGERIATPFVDENLLNVTQPEHIEGLVTCLDYFETVDDPFSNTLLADYKAEFPDWEQARLAGGSGTTGMFRGLMMWAGAVEAAGSTDTEAVRTEIDSISISEGPGGPSRMVAGTHHAAMNMYIAEAVNGVFEIREELGTIEPEECEAA